MKLEIEEAVRTNSKAVEVATQAQETLIGVPSTIIKHLKHREGEKGVSYLDSVGKLTGGIGHLLSKEEQKKYPKGTDIPKEVYTKWLFEDSQGSYNSAKKQAKDFGIEDEEFIGALTSVNFQMGANWKSKFPSAYKHLKNKKYDRAIQEILYTSEGSGIHSDWHKQTPKRTTDFISAIQKLSK